MANDLRLRNHTRQHVEIEQAIHWYIGAALFIVTLNSLHIHSVFNIDANLCSHFDEQGDENFSTVSNSGGFEVGAERAQRTISQCLSLLLHHYVPRSCLINLQNSKLAHFRQRDTDDFILEFSQSHFLALRQKLPVWTLFLRQRGLLESAQIHEVEIGSVVPVVLYSLLFHFCDFNYDK